MIKKITPIVFLFSTVFSAETPSIDIKETESTTIIKKDSNPGFSHIAKISVASLLVAVIAGINAAYEQLDPINRQCDFYGLSFITPLFTVPIMSIIAGIIVSQKINLINFLLPPYIAIPTFYSTWLATHYFLTNYKGNHSL